MSQDIVQGNAEKAIVVDIRTMISDARQRVAVSANAAITLLYWHIGARINSEVLDNKRAEYGKRIVEDLAVALQQEFGGREFSVRNLRRMMQFANEFPNLQIVSTLSTQLSWSHFKEVLPIENDLQREFYLTIAAEENWSIRTLRSKVDGMLFERTAIASKPDEIIRTELENLRSEHAISPELVFKSPYFLDFTGLKGNYSESELEDALISHIENFLLELGGGFTFVARQKRIIIDGEDFKADLLFFHRKLHRMIVIDLKLGKFGSPVNSCVKNFKVRGKIRILAVTKRRKYEREPIYNFSTVYSAAGV